MPQSGSRGTFGQWGAGWDWDWDADSSPSPPPAASSPSKHDDDSDDSDLAWRMQLEDLRIFDESADLAFLAAEDEDEEFAISQQVAEIEAAEAAEREGRDAAFLMAMEEVGAWWAGEAEEGLGKDVRFAGRKREKASSSRASRRGRGDGQQTQRRSSTPPRSSTKGGEATASATRSSYRSERPQTRVPRPTCAVCHDSQSPASSPATAFVTLPCKHVYCSPCLDELFRTAIADLSLFPPRCCGVAVPVDGCHPPPQQANKATDPPRPAEGYRKHLAPSTAAAFEHRCAKLNQDAKAGRSDEQDEEEAKDGATKEFLSMAEACGWARCCTCRRFVELEFGCNHMTCPCGAHFCYACNAPWKTCACAQWDEARLLERATHLVAAQQQQQQQQQQQHPPNPPQPHQEEEDDAADDNDEDEDDHPPVPPRAPTPPPPPPIPDDPPPPYPGRRTPDAAAYPPPFYGWHHPPPPPPQPLTREEYARLRASVRAAVGMLNRLLADIDENEQRCGHARWKAVVEAGLQRCEVCARFYGVDIWYRGGDGEAEEDGVLVCEGCGVRACWFCRGNRV